MWGPRVIRWFISLSNYSYLRTINHSEIGVMFTNLAIVWGPHLVGETTVLVSPKSMPTRSTVDKAPSYSPGVSAPRRRPEDCSR